MGIVNVYISDSVFGENIYFQLLADSINRIRDHFLFPEMKLGAVEQKRSKEWNGRRNLRANGFYHCSQNSRGWAECR